MHVAQSASAATADVDVDDDDGINNDDDDIADVTVFIAELSKSERVFLSHSHSLHVLCCVVYVWLFNDRKTTQKWLD